MNTASRIDRLTLLAEGLGRGHTYPLTRLTLVKPMCERVETALAFASFGASAAVRLLPQGPSRPGSARQLALSVRTRIARVRSARDAFSQPGLPELLDRVVSFQSEHRRVPWGIARVIHSRPLFVAEGTLRLVLASDNTERGVLGYRLAALLTRRYDPRYGDGLIPEAAPAVASLAHFFAHHSGA